MKLQTTRIAILMSIGVLLSWVLQGCSRTPKGYARYIPPEDARIRLQFEYPETWQVEENRHQHDIYIRDLENSDQAPDIGSIFIDRISDNTDTPEDALAWEKREAEHFDEVLLLQEETIVAGRLAMHFVYRRPPMEILSPEIVKTMTVDAIEDIYYVFGGDEPGYYIALRIPESDRNNAFGQGFDHLIATISYYPYSVP